MDGMGDAGGRLQAQVVQMHPGAGGDNVGAVLGEENRAWLAPSQVRGVPRGPVPWETAGSGPGSGLKAADGEVRRKCGATTNFLLFWGTHRNSDSNAEGTTRHLKGRRPNK